MDPMGNLRNFERGFSELNRVWKRQCCEQNLSFSDKYHSSTRMAHGPRRDGPRGDFESNRPEDPPKTTQKTPPEGGFAGKWIRHFDSF